MENNIKKFSAISLIEQLFLIAGFIPCASLSIIAGVSGVGKSSFLAALAARLSKGSGLYGEPQHQRKILICSAEDSYEASIKRRLNDAEANQENIYAFLFDSYFMTHFDEMLANLENCIVTDKIDLVILDPITNFIGKVNTNRADEVRGSLIKLQEIALRTKCAIVGIAHLNKTEKLSSLTSKILGSSEFVNLPRAVCFLGRHPYNPNARVLLNLKNSFGDNGTQLSFLLKNGKICDVKAENFPPTLLFKAQSPCKQSKLTMAMNWLSEILAKGPVSQQKIEKLCQLQAFSYSYVSQEAKHLLKIKSRRTPDGKSWEWYLPENSNQENE